MCKSRQNGMRKAGDAVVTNKKARNATSRGEHAECADNELEPVKRALTFLVLTKFVLDCQSQIL